MPLPEKQLVARIRAMAGRGWSDKSQLIAAGIGDDCAVLRPKAGWELLVTTDFNLEGTHFRREWHPADSVGHRSLARGLSDIAAMGGIPQAAFLSLAIPRDLPQAWVDGFLGGFLKLARRYGVTLAGGDLAQSPDGVLADVMVIGWVAKSRAILRSDARPGDRIYVTGSLGASRATLQQLFDDGSTGIRPRDKSHLRHFYPEPRIAIAAVLQKRRLATSMIDLSDGLSTDLAHVCEESGLGAVIDEKRLPIASGSTLDFALHGGEDYELLFTARTGKKIPTMIEGVRVTEIGKIARGKKISIENGKKTKKLESKGWEHFR